MDFAGRTLTGFYPLPGPPFQTEQLSVSTIPERKRHSDRPGQYDGTVNVSCNDGVEGPDDAHGIAGGGRHRAPFVVSLFLVVRPGAPSSVLVPSRHRVFGKKKRQSCTLVQSSPSTIQEPMGWYHYEQVVIE